MIKMRKIVFEREISNQEANLIRMNVEIEAVESDEAEETNELEKKKKRI